MTKLRVGLIYGGKSGEHEVSVLSAHSIMAAIDQQKYEVLPIGITKDGCWLPGQTPLALVESKVLEVRRLDGATGLAPNQLENWHGRILGGLREKIDVIFPVVHGPFGEDGTIQGLLELAGIPYVGGGVMASAVGMDKAIMKAVFAQNGLPVGDYLVYLRSELETDLERIAAKAEAMLGLPCFVKPVNLGSSVGISKAHDVAGLREAIMFAAQFDRKIIIEKMLTGREIECAVLGNDRPMASVPGEIVPCTDFYDYQAKYLLDDSKLIIPAELPDGTADRIRDLAIRAFRAIDCAGLARVDFFVDTKQDQIWVNEINTLPGFTKISMYPKLWEASGIGYGELIERLLDLALERYQDKSQNRLQ